MINLIVNLDNGEEVNFTGLEKANAYEAIQAAKTLYPNWSSIVLTLTRNEKHGTQVRR